MLHNLLKVMFWLALVFFMYGAIAAPVTYIQHHRSGARTMAAEALITWVLSVLCLALLWYTYDYFI
jgi:hypothetical protein